MEREPLTVLGVPPGAAATFGLEAGVYVLALEVAAILRRLDPEQLARFADDLEQAAASGPNVGPH